MIEIIGYWYENGERYDTKKCDTNLKTQKEFDEYRDVLLKKHKAERIFFTYKKL